MPRLCTRSVSRLACALFVALGVLGSSGQGQALPRPQPTCIRNVSLDRSGESEERFTLLLTDGKIEAILDGDAETPPGRKIIEGDGQLCLPAFVDAYARTGYAATEPVADQDVPVDVGSSVRVDMRIANRKGIQPAFRAVEALAIEKGESEAWREAGFGAALVSPGGQLLAGTSCLATTREAAMRDVVLRPDVFASAAFQAAGSGYPSTLMGYTAQLRQFFLDAARHAEGNRRHAEGRPTQRPAFDPELDAGALILSGERTVLCEAETHRDMERWLKLADDFGFQVAFVGGRDAWRMADTLAELDVPVFLTLDWGKEVDDPLEKAKAKDKDKNKAKDKDKGDEAEPEVEAPEAAAGETAEPEASEEVVVPTEKSAEEDDEPVWEYEEPLAVRIERRAEWEEGRASAQRLHEAGVRFAFGSASEKPGKLLEKVRTLVEEGLPAEVALRALTTTAAELLGASQNVGTLSVGHDASLVLWSADPLTEKKAKPTWVFVDGFPTEFDAPEEDEQSGGAPDEGVNASGTWNLVVEDDEGDNEMQLVLVMEEDGSVEGELHFENPMDDSPMSIAVTGRVAGKILSIDGMIEIDDFSMEFDGELTLDGDEASGEFTYTADFFPDGLVRTAEGTREPEQTVRFEAEYDSPHGAHRAHRAHGEQGR